MTSVDGTITECPADHPLVFLPTPKAGWRCDVCFRIVQRGTEMWSCRRCEYDVCARCVGDDIPMQNVRSILKAATALDGDEDAPRHTMFFQVKQKAREVMDPMYIGINRENVLAKQIFPHRILRLLIELVCYARNTSFLLSSLELAILASATFIPGEHFWLQLFAVVVATAHRACFFLTANVFSFSFATLAFEPLLLIFAALRVAIAMCMISGKSPWGRAFDVYVLFTFVSTLICHDAMQARRCVRILYMTGVGIVLFSWMCSASTASLFFKPVTLNSYILLGITFNIEWTGMFQNGLATVMIFVAKDLLDDLLDKRKSKYLRKPVVFTWYDPDRAVTVDRGGFVDVEINQVTGKIRESSIRRARVDRRAIGMEGFLWALYSFGVDMTLARAVFVELAGFGATTLKRHDFFVGWHTAVSKRRDMAHVKQALEADIRADLGTTLALTTAAWTLSSQQRLENVWGAISFRSESVVVVWRLQRLHRLLKARVRLMEVDVVFTKLCEKRLDFSLHGDLPTNSAQLQGLRRTSMNLTDELRHLINTTLTERTIKPHLANLS